MTIDPWEARNYFPRNLSLPVQEISLSISSNSSVAFWEISPLGNITVTFLRNVTFAFQEFPWYLRKFPPCFPPLLSRLSPYGLLGSSAIAFYEFPEYFPSCKEFP